MAASRRTFLALTGVAATAAASAPLAAGAALATGAAAGSARARPAGDPLVAYVADASSGQVALMVGEREVVVHDPELVQRLNAHLA
jgi:anti-sigma-K factor RskA